MEHLRSLNDVSPDEIRDIIILAKGIKADPASYDEALAGKTLLMLFEKPSLRTRVSFETGMTRMGGHAIFYSIKDSPLGKKENIHDTAKCAGRYVNLIMARTYRQEDIDGLAAYAGVPVINALTDRHHPCQILSDLLTISEKKGSLKGLKLAYLGDADNNVTHSLLLGCALTGMHIAIGCPAGSSAPAEDVVAQAKAYAQTSGSTITITQDAAEAAEDADVVYTDSWMSYHIPAEEKEARRKLFMPYQVNAELMRHAKPDAVFMNCLPAERGAEQTAEVIDGPQSVVFDQAENRLWAQNAIMLTLLKKSFKSFKKS
ncbi:MAG: ornithine carbamoyltransferase [DPANN group archaeon]|nr:ornithine carbamoyltransferase [DPANN group archaeon]